MPFLPLSYTGINYIQNCYTDGNPILHFNKYGFFVTLFLLLKVQVYIIKKIDIFPFFTMILFPHVQ